MKKIPIYLVFAFMMGSLAMKSCRTTPETVSCFPQAPVNVSLNLNLPAYQKLQNANGWVFVQEQSAGTNGLILVNTGSGYKAYDRNAPHLCPGQNTVLQVKDDTKIICPADGAEWILLTGQPLKISTIPPKSYPVSFDAATNTLLIYY